MSLVWFSSLYEEIGLEELNNLTKWLRGPAGDLILHLVDLKVCCHKQHTILQFRSNTICGIELKAWPGWGCISSVPFPLLTAGFAFQWTYLKAYAISHYLGFIGPTVKLEHLSRWKPSSCLEQSKTSPRGRLHYIYLSIFLWFLVMWIVYFMLRVN